MSARACLGSSDRLRSGSDFRRVFRRGWRLDGPLFLLLVAPNGRDGSRMGLAVGRKVGSAVHRTRAKRLLRESFRRHKEATSGFDVVLVPRAELARSRFQEVEVEYLRRLAAFKARQARMGRTHAPGSR